MLPSRCAVGGVERLRYWWRALTSSKFVPGRHAVEAFSAKEVCGILEFPKTSVLGSFVESPQDVGSDAFVSLAYHWQRISPRRPVRRRRRAR